MDVYTVVYGDTITIKDLQKIDRSTLKRIKQDIETKLTVAPSRFGKPLRTSLKGYRRLRIGSWRVIFKIEQQTVRIVFIGKKPEVYHQLLKVLK
jgi:mRNA interferase RelE/StbE